MKAWLRALRPHQWVKNVLIVMPLLLAHELSWDKWQAVFLAFLAFCMAASGNYLINDVLDRENDARHPEKRHRPIASGVIGAGTAMIVGVLLILSAFLIAASLRLSLVLALLCYVLLALAYSLRLKKMALVDVFTLATLYTLRIIAGSVAAAVLLSPWLMAFSIFLFLSLGLVKRSSELGSMAASGTATDVPGRGYRVDDLPMLQVLGVAAGFAAVMVMSLYITDPNSIGMYSKSDWLWGIVGVLLFWISRVWLVTHRGGMHHDPIVFALRDVPSLCAGLLCLVVAVAAL